MFLSAAIIVIVLRFLSVLNDYHVKRVRLSSSFLQFTNVSGCDRDDSCDGEPEQSRTRIRNLTDP